MAARSMGRRIKPGGGYELFMWYFMRLSGLALVFLAVGHLFITLGCLVDQPGGDPRLQWAPRDPL
jgi:succinate dehydrogenase hydrophobic anchor subunit